MKPWGGLVAGAALAAVATHAAAQEGVTVTSLLAEGYTVVSTVLAPVGPGIFLQKGDKLVICFVEETRASPTLTTLYCKPVT